MHKLKSTNKLYCNKQQDSVMLHVGELLEYGCLCICIMIGSNGWHTNTQANRLYHQSPGSSERGWRYKRPSRKDTEVTKRLVQYNDKNDVSMWKGLQELEWAEDTPSKN